jgi:hypothetical protein
MVSLVDDIESEIPGSLILKGRQFEDVPDRDFLMHQQGLFSGKTVGDLDSVPGYYGGTASYKFVQNAHVFKQHRRVRYRDQTAINAESGVKLAPTLRPSEVRIAAYKLAKLAHMKPPLKGPAQGESFRVAGEFGAMRLPRLMYPRVGTQKGHYRRGPNGVPIYVPPPPGQNTPISAAMPSFGSRGAAEDAALRALFR